MSAQYKPREDLPRILHEWAEWALQAEAAGYPSSDSLWRAQFARRSTGTSASGHMEAVG